MSEVKAKREKIVDGYTLTYSSEWTKNIESIGHWEIYWHQARLLRERLDKSGRLVEIGVGSGFLSGYLKSLGWEVFTLDIDEEKKPDVVGDMSSVDLSGYEGSSVAAFEVFEHVPVPLLRKTLENLKASKINKIIFSLPWCERRLIDFSIELPKMKKLSGRLVLPSRTVRTENHFWELSKLPRRSRESIMRGSEKGCISHDDLKRLFAECGYEISMEDKVKYIQLFTASAI